MLPIRQSVRLSRGVVVLRAWPARVADAHLHELLTLTATLGHIRESWQEVRRQDVTAEVWSAFWRLVRASLEQGSTLPGRLTWMDRLYLLEAMWVLNDLEEAESKVTALNQRVIQAFHRVQGQTTRPSTN
jgi:hypothetical protein